MKVFIVDYFRLNDSSVWGPIHVYIVAESMADARKMLVSKYGPCDMDNTNFCELDTTKETIGAS